MTQTDKIKEKIAERIRLRITREDLMNPRDYTRQVFGIEDEDVIFRYGTEVELKLYLDYEP